MKLNAFWCAALALVMLVPTVRPGAAAGTLPKNTTILIIRHAENPDDGNALSPAGEARAQAYIDYFKSYKVDGQPLKLDYIFAAKDSKNSSRPRLTIEPLAQALNLKVGDKVKQDDVSKLVSELEKLPDGKTILICWHHTKIPDLIEQLGGDPAEILHKRKWPIDQYDWVVQLRYDADGHLAESKRIVEGLKF